MTDRIKGLKMPKGGAIPISKKMGDGTIARKSTHRKQKPPKQAKHSTRKMTKKITIPVASPDSDRSRGADCGLDGNLKAFGVAATPRKKSSGRSSSPSPASKRSGALGFNDDQIGSARAFLATLLGGGFDALDGQSAPAGSVPSAPSVPAVDNAQAGIPIAGGRL